MIMNGRVRAIAKKTIRDIDVTGKRVLLRVDFNVPLDNGQVADDTRIRAALPTVKYLLEQNAKVILISHLGRPKGQFNKKFAMDPVAVALSKLLGRQVLKVDACVGDIPKQAVEKMRNGDVILLENVRFYAEEEKNDENFARQLAELADIYVDDAFGTAHRAHASTAGVAKYLPAVAGFLMDKELTVLGRLLSNPEHPFLAIVGGAKVSDKIAVISNLLNKVDRLILGGGMANTFLKAQGYDVGTSLVELDRVDLAKSLMEEAKNRGVDLFLPVDVVVARSMDPDAERTPVPVDGIPAGWMALDIGPKSVENFAAAIKPCKTVVWNGPMGVFEMEPFAAGTVGVARALGEVNGITVVGGGDSVSAVHQAGIADKITHISTGGGATLEFLQGRKMPGVEVLLDK